MEIFALFLMTLAFVKSVELKVNHGSITIVEGTTNLLCSVALIELNITIGDKTEKK